MAGEDDVSTWAYSSLRIVAPEIGVDEVTRRLGTPPRHHSDNPVGPARFHRRGIWLYTSGLEAKRDLREHMWVVANFIRDHADEVRELATKHFADMTVTFVSEEGPRSFTIPIDLLRILVDANVHLVLSLYPPSERDGGFGDD